MIGTEDRVPEEPNVEGLRIEIVLKIYGLIDKLLDLRNAVGRETTVEGINKLIESQRWIEEGT